MLIVGYRIIMLTNYSIASWKYADVLNCRRFSRICLDKFDFSNRSASLYPNRTRNSIWYPSWTFSNTFIKQFPIQVNEFMLNKSLVLLTQRCLFPYQRFGLNFELDDPRKESLEVPSKWRYIQIYTTWSYCVFMKQNNQIYFTNFRRWKSRIHNDAMNRYCKFVY